MISNNKLKFIRSLKSKKFRDKHKKSILEGFRLIDESIKYNAEILNIWTTEEFMHFNKNFIDKIKKKYNVDTIGCKDLQLISDTKHSQGIIAEVGIKIGTILKSQRGLNENIVILNNISDPGNLGTIFRTCAWYGIREIILSSNTVDPFNPKCLRSGVGAHFYFENIFYNNNQDIINFLTKEKYHVLCADLEGENISQLSINSKWALILSSEAHGVSLDFDKFNKVTIKKIGDMESLNVSVSCGILLNKLTQFSK